MTRRLEAGPLLVTLGALLLLVSLFLNWYTGEITAWQGLEVWDLVSSCSRSARSPPAWAHDAGERGDRPPVLPAGVAAVAVVVASQLLDPPPAAAGQDPDTGAWLALGAALVMCAGAVLTFGRVGLAVTVEGRDRQRVAAVDARGPEDTTDSIRPCAPASASEGARAAAAASRPNGRRRRGRAAGPKPAARNRGRQPARQGPAPGPKQD